MKASVVVCTYSTERYESFSETVESVLVQTYEPLELVIAVDGSEEEFDRVQDDFGDIDDVVLCCNDKNRGIPYSRTKGAELGTGDVVAIIDDDVTAEPDQIEMLVDTYENNPDVVAVGGIAIPDWVARKPEFFPKEFYWFVGRDEHGSGEYMEGVRNTYGSNTSFKRDALLGVGGYDTNTGRRGDKHAQTHEAPICIRIYEQTGGRVIYNKQARANHRLFEYRTEFGWFAFRSFWQGHSRRVMDLLYPQALDDKNTYLKDLVLIYVVDRLKSLVEDPSLAQVRQLIAIFVFIAAVGFGYVYGLLTSNLVGKTDN